MNEDESMGLSNRRIRSSFLERRRNIYRTLFVLVVVVGIGGYLQATGTGPAYVPLLIYVSAMVAALVINLKLWRCPACNGHLGKLYIGLDEPTYCPNCGTQLMEV